MESLKEKLLREQQEVFNKIYLFKLYPDLSEFQGRWESYFQSKIVNLALFDFKIAYRRSCGCCADAVIYAMPYIEVNGIRVYTNPAQIAIGEGLSWGSGISPYESWKYADICNEMKQEIQKYLDENPPIYDTDED